MSSEDHNKDNFEQINSPILAPVVELMDQGKGNAKTEKQKIAELARAGKEENPDLDNKRVGIRGSVTKTVRGVEDGTTTTFATISITQ